MKVLQILKLAAISPHQDFPWHEKMFEQGKVSLAICNSLLSADSQKVCSDYSNSPHDSPRMIHLLSYVYGHCFPSPVPNVTSILPSFAPGQISSITSQCLLTGSQSAEKQKILNYLQYYHKSTKQKSKRPNIQCNAQKRIFSKDVNHNAKKSQAFLAFPFPLRFCAGRVALLRWNTI